MPPASERELKIELDILQPGSFRAKFTFENPDDAAAGNSVNTSFTIPDGLASKPNFDSADNAKSPYGQALADALFADDIARDFYNKSIGNSASSSLRIRLYCSASAQELHALRWELLCDPATGRVLSINQNTPFCRFISTSEWKTVHLTQKSKLRALIAVSNPSDIKDNGLAPINVHAEVIRAWLSLAGQTVPPELDPALTATPLPNLPATLQSRFGLGDMHQITVLGHSEPVTGDNLLREFANDVDIVYLVCHGTNTTRPLLYLQKADGTLMPTDGLTIANRVRALKSPPRLIVLASCESALIRTDGTIAEAVGTFAETAIAPLLADAGVPAIVAMQGKITMPTVALMMPEFFRHLASHGNIAQSMADARRVAMSNKRFDAWMPALFLRLKAGSLWYKPGFGTSAEEEDFAWASIVEAVRKQALFPIIGQDLAEHILGSSAEIASALADANTIPRPQSEKPDAARVTQAVETKLKREALYASLNTIAVDRLNAAALRIDPSMIPSNKEQPLLNVIVDALAKDPTDPLNILAGLEVKVFAYAASDLILKNLLRKHGKIPYEMCVDWRDETVNDFDRVSTAAAALLQDFEAASPEKPRKEIIDAWASRIMEAERRKDLPISLRTIRDALLDRLDDNPDVLRIEVVRAWRQSLIEPPGDKTTAPWPVKTPVVYYVYGKKTYRDSLVLTEDDFFDYLIKHSKFDLMPPMITSSLLMGSVVFLGFSLDDWKFRILFRTIMQKGGASLLEKSGFKHVGVQLDPDDYTPDDAIRLKKLLKDYFTASQINIYWGSSADFLRELRKRLDAAPSEIEEAR
jgi:hypothetical protein